MKILCIFLTALLITVLVGITVANSAMTSGSSAAYLSPDQSNIAVQLTALQQPDGVRYSVTIINSEAQALPGLSALVAVPPGVNLVQALETDGYTHFLGALSSPQGLDLSWSANFAAGDYVDAFVFTLDSQPVGNIGVNLKWGGDQPGQIEFWGQPPVLATGLSENNLALSAAGTGDSLLPVGGTGVLVGVAPGQVPDGTTIHVRLMPTSENPGVTNDLWWCSAVEITGLPTGAEITVLVPLREPLPPGAPVALFSRQSDGQWAQLAAEGIVTFDGQHIAYAHHGGAVATGIQNTFQPKLKLLKPISPQPTTVSQINQPKPTVGNPPTNVPPPPVRVSPTAPKLIVLAGTPTKIANPPVISPTPVITRPTKLQTPFVPVTRLAPTPLIASALPLILTATAATKRNVITATPASACTAVGVVCFSGSGLISFCTLAGVNCISTSKSGATCFTLAVDGRVQCTAPGGTVIFAPGGLIPGIRLDQTDTPVVKRSPGLTKTFSLAPSATPTPLIIIVTATFLPQPTVCVENTSGTIDCTNQNGQLLPLPTATIRADGGECFNVPQSLADMIVQGLAGAFAAPPATLCVDANGLECFQPSGDPRFPAPVGCLSPNQPGYITPP